jgi:hypothetical protein
MDTLSTYDSLGDFSSYTTTGGSDLSNGQDNGESSFVFASTNDIKKSKKIRKSFEDLGFVDFLGFTNVDLLAMPDFGYNTELDVVFQNQQVVIKKLARKKTPDIVLLFKDNAKGLRRGPAGGQSKWANGFKVKSYFSDVELNVVRGDSALELIESWPESESEFHTVDWSGGILAPEVSFYANRPDDNIRVYVTRMLNWAAKTDKTLENLMPTSTTTGMRAGGTQEEEDKDSIARWRHYEFMSVDDGLDDVETMNYPTFAESTQRLISGFPPQVAMLYDILGGTGSKSALKSAYDEFMQTMFVNAATAIAGADSSTDRRAWLYGAIMDDITASDFDYMIARSAFDGYADSDRDTDYDQDGDDGEEYIMYHDAFIYDYDDDGARDGEHKISEDDGILGKSRSQIVPGGHKRVMYLDPKKYGGKFVNPPFFIEPKASPGWKGIVDIMFPDLRPCKPHMTEAVDFQEVKDMIDRVYPRIPSDHRLKHSEECKVEVPYNRILERAGRAGLMGVIVSLIKIYAATHFLKALPTFTAFAPKFPTNYSNAYAGYIVEVMEESIKEPISILAPFSSNPFWYAFLEQSVQMYAWRVDDGDIPEEDVPEAVQEALIRLNNLQEGFSYPWHEDLLKARATDDAGEFESLESYRIDKNLEAVKATEEDAKLVLTELVKEQLNIVGDTFMRNLEKAGFKPEIYDLDYYFMSQWAAESTLDLDKKIKQVSEGLPTLEDGGAGPHYTNGNEFSLVDGSTYVGYYHIYKFQEDDPFLGIDAGQEVYMVGEQHSDDEHEMLRPFANKQKLAGEDGSPIGGVPAIGTAAADASRPFLIEKWVSIDGAKQAPADARNTIVGLGTGNISDYYPGDMKLVKDDSGRVVGVEGELGVLYGLDFSMSIGGGAPRFITSVQISALDIPVTAFPEALQDNSVLLYCLIEKLKKDEKFKILTSYIFSFKKVLALMAIYNDMGFLPSIGEVTCGEGDQTGSQILGLTPPGTLHGSASGKPGAHATVDFEPDMSAWDGDEPLTIEGTNIEYVRGWADLAHRTPLVGNPFVLKYDEWDQRLLRNSTKMARKIFYAHYNSRDFGLADGSDGPKQWLEQLKARFKLAPPSFLGARARNMRTNPFNADGNLCDKQD